MSGGARPGSSALIVGLCAALGVWLWSARAAAQSERYPPPVEDYDDAHERPSQLWERTLEPDEVRYRERVGRAMDRLAGRDAESVRRAERELLGAVELMPEDPRAHWVLAVLYEDEERWPECVDAYRQVAVLDPVYTPPAKALPEGRGPDWALDFGLARCHAQRGDYERAIARYQRILRRGASLDGRVYRGLGEAYMALGRLREAQAALELAYQQDPQQWHVNYALAVAYDRAGMPAQASEALAVARRHDPAIDTLEAPGALYTPPSDRYYYLGLAHQAHDHAELAMAYFRHYLAVAGESPWARRARQHIQDLGRDPLPHIGSIRVSDKVHELDVVARAVGEARSDLHACLAETPNLVLEVRITTVVDRPRRRRGVPVVILGRPRPTPGVKAVTLYSFATTAEDNARVTACVEARAERIELPRVRGDEAQYRTLVFPLIAPP